MNDWPSRKRPLEQLTHKARRREASPGEPRFLIVACNLSVKKVSRSLRNAQGVLYQLTTAR